MRKLLLLICFGGAAIFTAPKTRIDIERSSQDVVVEVLVAKVSVGGWILLKHPEDQFARELRQLYEVPPDAIRSFDELRDRRLIKRLEAGQLARMTNLVRSEDVGKTHDFLPPSGFITVLVHNTEDDRLETIRPGIRVNVCKRIQRPGGRVDREIVTAVLVEKVEMIEKGAKVTLAKLSPEELQRLRIGVSMHCDFFLVLQAVKSKENKTSRRSAPVSSPTRYR